MTDLSERPFVDTLMTTIVFYGFDRRLPILKAKALVATMCELLDEMPTHVHFRWGTTKRSRIAKFSSLDKIVAKVEADDYAFFEAVNYFEEKLFAIVALLLV